ncbi:flagellar brake protein [Aneurinibacillus terranovensis]|uniref:flagellar brake protein n=1 Tax=Aneurinibacillus terranovensis TaxID=278991 RepID=UPI00040BBFA8|nr:flagellar brake domain-containing protein [Aneurinibacillus terranovensis]
MLPKIGQMVRFQLQTLNEEESKRVYKSRVADMTDDEFAIEIPTNEQTGRSAFIPVKAKIHLWYFSDDGSKYEFTTIVTGRKNDNIPLLVIQQPVGTIARTQRRNYLRVPAALEIALKRVNESAIHFLARTVDISGGGLSFLCEESIKLKTGDLFSCWITLPIQGGIQHACFTGEVVRIDLPRESGLPQSISLKFKEIQEPERQKIILYGFERQRFLRQKGVE